MTTDDPLTLEIFSALMELDTINPPGNERRAALYLRNVCMAHGVSCVVQELGNNRANFVATIGTGDPVLELGGHLDVVPCPGAWDTPPLRATQVGERFYGRGACDMKGGVAAMCAAALSLHCGGVALRGTLRLAFVTDEEHANMGMHAYLRAFPAADWAIIGEPTDLRVAIAHRGVARYFIDVHGAARHAALPAQEESAVTRAARAVLALDAMNAALQSETHEILPPPSLAVTQMQGYEKDNIVPGTVRLLTDFRLLPGMDEGAARAVVEATLSRAGILGCTLEKRHYMPGGALPGTDTFARRCREVINEAVGTRQALCAFDASCEQCFLLQAGAKAVIFGPGSLAQAHTVNEFVEREQLLQATECYQALALAFLCEAAPD